MYIFAREVQCGRGEGIPCGFQIADGAARLLIEWTARRVSGYDTVSAQYPGSGGEDAIVRAFRGFARVALLALCALGIVALHPMLGIAETGGAAYAAQPFPTVPPVNPDFEDPFEEAEPTAPEFEDFVLIGDHAYPIGDEFMDADHIPLGPVTQDFFGWHGYATIKGHPDLRLIWHTDSLGRQHNLIMEVGDPLFAGNPGVDNGDGF